MLPIQFYDQIRCIFRLSGTLRTGNIVIFELVHALPCVDRVAIQRGKGICKILLIPTAVAAVFRLAVNDVADNAVNIAVLLHQRRVAAACAIACCDRWTDFAGLPDTGINTMILIYQGLMPLFAGAERTGHIFTHIHPLSTLFVQAHNRRHTVAAWTALECWGDFLCVADGSSRCAGASGKRRGKCLLLHSRLCKDGRIIKRHRFLSAFRQANQASLYP